MSIPTMNFGEVILNMKMSVCATCRNVLKWVL